MSKNRHSSQHVHTCIIAVGRSSAKTGHFGETGRILGAIAALSGEKTVKKNRRWHRFFAERTPLRCAYSL
jgi:hypothetical protein